jgi:hypothetical protein
MAAIEAVRYINRKSNLWMMSRQTISDSSTAQDNDAEDSEESKPTFVPVNIRTAELG